MGEGRHGAIRGKCAVMALPLLSVFSVALSWWKAKQEARLRLWQTIADIFARHWRIILPLAIVALVLIKINALVNERDYWKKLYTDLDQTIYTANQVRQAELKAARDQGKKDVVTVIAKHQDDMTKIMRKVRSDEKINTRTINNYRDGLRLAIEREANLRARVSEDDSHRLTGTDSDTALAREQYIKTLEQAGAVCAADYNLCRDYVRNEQLRLGIED